MKHVLSFYPKAQNIGHWTREPIECKIWVLSNVWQSSNLTNTFKHVKTCLKLQTRWANGKSFCMFYCKSFTIWTGVYFQFCIFGSISHRRFSWVLTNSFSRVWFDQMCTCNVIWGTLLQLWCRITSFNPWTKHITSHLVALKVTIFISDKVEILVKPGQVLVFNKINIMYKLYFVCSNIINTSKH